MIATPALAEWDEDYWLWNIIGPERLALGDEFGCHGYEGVDIREAPLVVEDCRDYLVGFADSSRWGPKRLLACKMQVFPLLEI